MVQYDDCKFLQFKIGLLDIQNVNSLSITWFRKVLFNSCIKLTLRLSIVLIESVIDVLLNISFIWYILYLEIKQI